MRSPRFALTLGLLAALILPLASGAPARAQGTASFTAEVDRTATTLGESIVYEVTLSTGDGSRVQGYKAPDFRGFRVLGEYPSQSTQIQMGGGTSVMRTVYSWRYELSAAQSGRQVIGPARVKIGNRELRTASVTVNVEAGDLSPSGRAAAPAPGRPPARAPARRTPRFSHPFDDFLGRREPAPAPRGPEVLVLRAVADKPKVYVGQQVRVEWLLYASVAPSSMNNAVESRTDGFWSEELTVPQAPGGGYPFTQEMHEGQVVQVVKLFRKALFPLQSGKLTITPMEVDVAQSDFFGRPVNRQRLKSEALTIEVVPLPTAKQPPDFDPSAVGTFTMDAKVDRARVAVGDAVTVKLTITGAGNLRKLNPPPLPAIEGWRSYDPKVDLKVENTDDISGVKTVEYLLLPQRPGLVTIPAFVLPYFDPGLREYAVARTAPLKVEAVGDPRSAQAGGAAGSVPAGAAVENVLPSEIRPPRATPVLSRDLGSNFYGTTAFLLLVVLPPVGLGLTALGERLRARLGRETDSSRRRRSRALVQGHLKAAAAELDRGNGRGFHVEIDRVLRGVLDARLHRPVAGLSRAELADELTASGLPRELADRVVNELEACDRARFSPGSADAHEMRATLDRAGELILQIERTPPAGKRRPS